MKPTPSHSSNPNLTRARLRLGLRAVRNLRAHVEQQALTLEELARLRGDEGDIEAAYSWLGAKSLAADVSEYLDDLATACGFADLGEALAGTGEE